MPWPAPRPRRWLPTLFILAAGAAVGSGLWLATRTRGHDEPRPVTTPSVSAATPAAATPATLPPLVESRARVPEAHPPAERPATAGTGRAAVAAPPAAEPGAGLQLQAIAERDGHPVAVLNNRVVREGDRFDGVTVVRIGADEVEIEAQGRRRTLHF